MIELWLNSLKYGDYSYSFYFNFVFVLYSMLDNTISGQLIIVDHGMLPQATDHSRQTNEKVYLQSSEYHIEVETSVHYIVNVGFQLDATRIEPHLYSVLDENNPKACFRRDFPQVSPKIPLSHLKTSLKNNDPVVTILVLIMCKPAVVFLTLHL